ncbi:hypothetical protein [Streptomyces sp. NPDC004266]|uniref:hypothetical protein n=1 Tax=Streptomyces sp. NPDC004266 TaxID=3364693 RepID=UPI0036CC7846
MAWCRRIPAESMPKMATSSSAQVAECRAEFHERCTRTGDLGRDLAVVVDVRGGAVVDAAALADTVGEYWQVRTFDCAE